MALLPNWAVASFLLVLFADGMHTSLRCTALCVFVRYRIAPVTCRTGRKMFERGLREGYIKLTSPWACTYASCPSSHRSRLAPPSLPHSQRVSELAEHKQSDVVPHRKCEVLQQWGGGARCTVRLLCSALLLATCALRTLPPACLADALPLQTN